MAHGREVVPFHACVSKLTSERDSSLSFFSIYLAFRSLNRIFVGEICAKTNDHGGEQGIPAAG